jgi:hypothetical protein
VLREVGDGDVTSQTLVEQRAQGLRVLR